MAKLKLTKSAVDTAQPQAEPVELWDTLVPGFLCKITPAGRRSEIVSLQWEWVDLENRRQAITGARHG